VSAKSLGDSTCSGFSVALNTVAASLSSETTHAYLSPSTTAPSHRPSTTRSTTVHRPPLLGPRSRAVAWCPVLGRKVNGSARVVTRLGEALPGWAPDTVEDSSRPRAHARSSGGTHSKAGPAVVRPTPLGIFMSA
jgi:hypothetical protein